VAAERVVDLAGILHKMVVQVAAVQPAVKPLAVKVFIQDQLIWIKQDKDMMGEITEVLPRVMVEVEVAQVPPELALGAKVMVVLEYRHP
jgi:hypothetical protein